MNKHIGSSLDSFLQEVGDFDKASAIATKRVLAWQIQQAVKEKNISKRKLAQLMKTSESALFRLLDPENTSVTLRTISRAATALGKHVRIELVDPPAPAVHQPTTTKLKPGTA